MDLSIPSIDPASSQPRFVCFHHLSSAGKETHIFLRVQRDTDSMREKRDRANKEKMKLGFEEEGITERFCSGWVQSWPSDLDGWFRLLHQLEARWG